MKQLGYREYPSFTGAHGYFEVIHDITKYCKADLFSKVSEKNS